MNSAVVEKREALKAKHAKVGKVLELAGKDLDFTKKAVLEEIGATDAKHASDLFKSLSLECESLGSELQREELKDLADEYRKRDEELREPRLHLHPGRSGEERVKTIGELYVESKAFKESQASRTDIPFTAEIDLKTLLQTTAGFAPESVRSGLLVEKAAAPAIQVTDLIPSFPIGQAAFVYMEETTRTHAAAETAEGVGYPESTFVWTQRTSPVQKVADSIPVTDEQLEDAGQVRSLLDQRLTYGLRSRLDGQILVGNGTAPNLRGVLNVAGIQTQAKSTDSAIAAFLKALTKVRFTGFSNPSGAVFNPTDWQNFLLLTNSTGDFLFGNPFMSAGPQSLLGIPVALSTLETVGTGLVGDWRTFSRLDDRRGVNVQTGYVGTQFTEGKVTLRADLRTAFTVTRPAAFCTITGL